MNGFPSSCLRYLRNENIRMWKYSAGGGMAMKSFHSGPVPGVVRALSPQRTTPGPVSIQATPPSLSPALREE